jgi:hypothetical protein
MNSNPGIQNTGLIAWDGTTSYTHKVTDHNQFGWVFEVKTTLVADAIFKVLGHPPSSGDPCVPGTGVIVDEILICQAPIVAGTDFQFVIPSGTPAGTVCSGTIPCVPDEFASLSHISGGANVRAVLLLHAPHN